MDIGNKDKYIKLVAGAREGLEKLKKKILDAGIACEETKILTEKIKMELDKLMTHAKVLDKKVRVRDDISASSMRSLAQIEADLTGYNKMIADFLKTSKKSTFEKPADKFETYKKQLDDLEEKINIGECKTVDINKLAEEITKYAHGCINFTDFYNEYKSKLNGAYDNLKCKNEEFDKLNSEESWAQWFNKNFIPFIKATGWTIFTTVIGFYTNKILSEFYSE